MSLKDYQAPYKELAEQLRFSVWSQSSNPHQQGCIQIICDPLHGISIRWFGDKDWQAVPWDELTEIAYGDSGKLLKSNLESAREKGYSEGIQMAVDDIDETLINEKLAERKRLAKKLIQLPKPPEDAHD